MGQQPHPKADLGQQQGISPHFCPKLGSKTCSSHHISVDHGLMGCYPRGDVQPYINLSQGLRDAGHDVTLATNPTLCPLAEQHGIKTAPVGSPVDMGAEGARLLEKSGEKPVAVSLGVMGAAKARQSAAIVLDAVRRAGVRAIIQGWGDVLGEMETPPTVYSAGPMPHDWLFDQVSAVVHHGGFGTTAAGLRSGAPSIVIPHIIDQYYWGQRVFELGVGPKFFSRGKITAEKLAHAITLALTDTQMRAKAAALGAAIRSGPDGVTQAVRWIEQVD